MSIAPLGSKEESRGCICTVCLSRGNVLHRGVKDHLWGFPGRWDIYRCVNATCRTLWVNPVPDEHELRKAYFAYYTHEESDNGLQKIPSELLMEEARRILGYERSGKVRTSVKLAAILARMIPTWSDLVSLHFMGLHKNMGSRLLDVGCGNGAFLRRAATLGWDGYGVEPDPAAANVAANALGTRVFVGSLEEASFEDCIFDVITMNHVIEHVYEPRRLLSECLRLLRPGGHLVVTTPNAESLGHKWFKQDWRGLEVPRHLVIFTRDSLAQAVVGAGFSLSVLRTTARNARSGGWTNSVRIGRKREDVVKANRVRLAPGYVFQLLEGLLVSAGRPVGEEIVAIAIKR